MEEEVDVDTSAHAMEVEEYVEVPPIVDPNAQIPQIQWQDEENVHEKEHIHVEVSMEGEHPMHGAYPSQEGTSFQGEPPPWFLEYFNELKEPLGEIKQRQEEIIQTQNMHEQHTQQLAEIDAQLEDLWTHLVPPPPPPPFDPALAPPRPPFYCNPPY
ncbi:hypothetical protein Acr_11g0009300 [Actinidia rufa]|uniref:Uncharacterized protein n=1 Tax=Actinidia rufa TaxID=165716 RepID=A0A7J0FD47_9ERIC|nr:hypothetical protein Acr_11g0009300 [Actinidia rufa]